MKKEYTVRTKSGYATVMMIVESIHRGSAFSRDGYQAKGCIYLPRDSEASNSIHRSLESDESFLDQPLKPNWGTWCGSGFWRSHVLYGPLEASINDATASLLSMTDDLVSKLRLIVGPTSKKRELYESEELHTAVERILVRVSKETREGSLACFNFACFRQILIEVLSDFL